MDGKGIYSSDKCSLAARCHSNNVCSLLVLHAMGIQWHGMCAILAIFEY